MLGEKILSGVKSSVEKKSHDWSSMSVWAQNELNAGEAIEDDIARKHEEGWKGISCMTKQSHTAVRYLTLVLISTFNQACEFRLIYMYVTRRGTFFSSSKNVSLILQ